MMDMVTVSEMAELLAFNKLEPAGPLEEARQTWLLINAVWEGKEPPKLDRMFPQLAADEE